jgi:hypothetical protein
MLVEGGRKEKRMIDKSKRREKEKRTLVEGRSRRKEKMSFAASK